MISIIAQQVYSNYIFYPRKIKGEASFRFKIKKLLNLSCLSFEDKICELDQVQKSSQLGFFNGFSYQKILFLHVAN